MLTCLDDWRLSVFGTRMFLLRMPGRYGDQEVDRLRSFQGSTVGQPIDQAKEFMKATA